MALPNRLTCRYLLELPDELLILVVEKLTQETSVWNGKGLSNFRQTCKHLHRLAEPIWIKQLRLNRSSHPRHLDFVLNRDPRRTQNVQTLEITPSPLYTEPPALSSKLRFISRFANLRVLKVAISFMADTSEQEQPHETLDCELKENGLAELQECSLHITTSWKPRICGFKTDRLLRAPKLVKLTLRDLDLRQFPPQSIDNHSAALEELSILSCQVDDPSISALLSKPRSLKSLTFGSLKSPHHGDLQGNSQRAAEELDMTRMMARVLGLAQPNLHELSIYFTRLNPRQASTEGQSVDLHELKSLEQLTIASYCMDEAGVEKWRPASVFRKLPEGLQRITVKVGQGVFDVVALANALQGGSASQVHEPENTGEADTLNENQSLSHPAMNLPSSLQRFEIFESPHLVQGMPQRPFNRDDQKQDDKLQECLSRMANDLSSSRVQYTHRHLWSHEEEDGSTTCYFWERVLRASSRSSSENDDQLISDREAGSVEDILSEWQEKRL
ncbi:hypothetical protein H2200_005876 [Cladophialophora chaetospira]|uniref:F-box domain-containing protein n=1 Tax=Cladophialophora chaetospira TaxID=386627 RepID=A0AA38X9V9_9EURO|nr:hypothetical protein H2200_005876 [Cladophialophora chaetospira]